MHPNPAGQIARAGVDRTCRAYVVNVAPLDDFNLAALFRVRAGVVGRLLRFDRAEIGRLHAERIEDASLRELFPRTAGRRADNLPRRQKHDVLILKCRAEAVCQRNEADAFDDLFASPRRAVPEHVVTDEARAMRDDVAQRDVFIGQRIAQSKIRQMFSDRVVPIYLAFVGQHRHPGGDERFGGRTDGEDGVGRDRLLRGHILHAEALQINHLVAANDDHSRAGRLPVFHRLVHQRVESGLINRLRRGGQRKRDCHNEREDEIT
ncbi:MAG: hypothetical protein JMDDDDMK_03428 [Acidobacteria bacterium]|nr:hypothetical protein [Acidobacteriota bacterium]